MTDISTATRATGKHADDMAKLDKLAVALDSRFRIPGTNIRFGWDGLIGFIPGLGDVATFGPAAYLLYQGYKMGVSRTGLVRMAVNSGLDIAVGAVPVVGDLFDIGFKANLRNVAIMREELASRQTTLDAESAATA